MKRIMALLVAIGFVVVCGGVALAGADGECGYKAHSTQAGVDKVEAPAQPAVATADKATADKVLLVQTNQAAKPASETKK